MSIKKDTWLFRQNITVNKNTFISILLISNVYHIYQHKFVFKIFILEINKYHQFTPSLGSHTLKTLCVHKILQNVCIDLLIFSLSYTILINILVDKISYNWPYKWKRVLVACS